MYHDFVQLRDSCNFAGYTLNTEQPSLMAALAIGDEVFFSSQLRGSGTTSFVYASMPDVSIKEQLNLW